MKLIQFSINMKKAVPFLSLILAITFTTFAQATFQNTSGSTINLNNNGGSVLELAPKPSITEVSYYYNDQFRLGTIYLKDGRKFNNYPLKYDLSKKWIEVGVDKEVKIATDEIAEWFILFKPQNAFGQTFINVSNFKINDLKSSGFMELIADGKIKLLVDTKLELKPSNYNALMGVGEKNNTIVKREVVYFAKNIELVEVPIREKDIINFFGEKKETIENYINKYKLKLKKIDDLKELVDYYNTL